MSLIQIMLMIYEFSDTYNTAGNQVDIEGRVTGTVTLNKNNTIYSKLILFCI